MSSPSSLILIKLSEKVVPKTDRHIIKELQIDNLQKMGELTNSAGELIDTGIRCLKESGYYNVCTNNCQPSARNWQGSWA